MFTNHYKKGITLLFPWKTVCNAAGTWNYDNDDLSKRHRKHNIFASTIFVGSEILAIS
jgi:hypothetical protein